MMTLLFEKLLYKEIEKYNNKKILVAFSGGKDSLALLDFLNRNRERLGITLGACHINHGLRDTAIRDEVFCIDYCKRNNLDIHVCNISKDLAEDRTGGLESAARKYRYKALLTILQNKYYDYIFTAHTYSDNIESFFIDLYTGVSLFTISGIMEKNDKIVRPMLNITTDMVNEYIKYYNLTPVYDETNSDTKYVRNKIRHKIIPVLYECGYEFEKSISRIQKESLKLKEYFDFKTKHVIEHIGSIALVNREKFLLLEDIEKTFVLGKIFSIFFRVTKKNIDETLLFFSSNYSKRLDLPNGYMVEQSFNSIRVFPSSMVRDFLYYKNSQDDVLKTNDFIIEFKKCLRDKDLIIRNRRKGDRVKNKKLKDILIDRHIELFDRDRLVIVEKQGIIIWVENIIENENINFNRLV